MSPSEQGAACRARREAPGGRTRGEPPSLRLSVLVTQGTWTLPVRFPTNLQVGTVPRNNGVQPSSPRGGSGMVLGMPGLAPGGYGILGIGELQMPALGVHQHGEPCLSSSCRLRCWAARAGPTPGACTHPAPAWPIPQHPSASIQRVLREASLTPLPPLTQGKQPPRGSAQRAPPPAPEGSLLPPEPWPRPEPLPPSRFTQPLPLTSARPSHATGGHVSP